MVSRSIKFVFIFLTTSLLLFPSFAHAAPDLVITRGGEEVITRGYLFFEPTRVGETERFVFIIRNEGDEDLFFMVNPPVVISGAHTDQFSIRQPAIPIGGKLRPGSSRGFTVNFEPTRPSTQVSSSITIATNDPAGPFYYTFIGSSKSPDLSVMLDDEGVENGKVFNFDPTPIGGSRELVFTLMNIGNIPLKFLTTPTIALLGANAESFVVEQPELEEGSILSNRQSTTFAVRYEPKASAVSIEHASINIITDDADPLFALNFNGFQFYDCNRNEIVDADDITTGTSSDCNMNAIPDECEVLADSDGDATPDLCEVCPNDPEKTEVGICGCGVLDNDSDSDGTIDCKEECSGDSDKLFPGQCGCGVVDIDTDGDGISDCVDGCPNDSEKSAVGFCGCGVADEDLNENGVLDCQGEADFVSSLTLILREIRKSVPNQDIESLLLSEVRALALLESLSNSVTALDESTTALTKFTRRFNRLPRFIEGVFEGRIKRRRRMRRRAIRDIKKIRNFL